LYGVRLRSDVFVILQMCVRRSSKILMSNARNGDLNLGWSRKWLFLLTRNS
jgi:hypothetical protein